MRKLLAAAKIIENQSDGKLNLSFFGSADASLSHEKETTELGQHPAAGLAQSPPARLLFTHLLVQLSHGPKEKRGMTEMQSLVREVAGAARTVTVLRPSTRRVQAKAACSSKHRSSEHHKVTHKPLHIPLYTRAKYMSGQTANQKPATCFCQPLQMSEACTHRT